MYCSRTFTLFGIIDMKNKNHSDRGHLECGGSNAHRFPRCTGSVFLARKVGKLPPSKAALLGTDTHELAEVCVEDFLIHKLTGSDPEKHYKEAKTFRDEAQVDAVEFYRDYIWNEVLEQSITNKAWGLEEKLRHAKCDKLGGTCDFWAAHINDKGERVLHIVDFKNGSDPVDIKHEQFIYYGLCFRSILRDNGKDIDRLVTHVVQPNALNGVQSQKKAYTVKQMDTKEEWFMKAVHKIYVDKKCTFKLGEWCKWCPGQSLCEKYGKKLEVDSGINLLAEEVKLPEVKSLTEKQAVALALHQKEIMELCKAAKAFIIGQHMEGKPIAGCKVIQTKPRRSLPKNQTALIKTLHKADLSDEKIYNKKLKGITELEKLLKDKKQILEPHLSVGKPTASVVAEDDPRPAATDLTELLVD